MSLNKVMIIGNLGRDPEMRYTPSGQAVTQFTVAVNRNYKDGQGEWQEETEWFRVVAWGPLAERTAEYLRKGRKVYVEGRLQTRQWEDRDGQKRYTTELIANTCTPLDRRPQEDGDGGGDDTFRSRPVGPGEDFREARPAGGGDDVREARPTRVPEGAARSGGDNTDDIDDLPF